MALPTEIEDWLTDEGDRVVNRIAESGVDATTQEDRAIYEVWLLDSETRNGGISQYFGNRDIARWQALAQFANPQMIPSLLAFVNAIDDVIAGSDDPYGAIMDSDVDLDTVYKQHQLRIVNELREFTVI